MSCLCFPCYTPLKTVKVSELLPWTLCDATGSGIWSPAVGEDIGLGGIAGRHWTLLVGRECLQNLQSIAAEDKAEYGNAIQTMYAPIISLIILVTQRDMVLGSRTINRAFPCVMARGTKCAHFDVKCNANQQTKGVQSLSLNRGTRYACSMQPKHVS